MILRSRQFLSEEGHPVTVSLDRVGDPFIIDCGNDGSHVYVQAFLDDGAWDEMIWGVYAIARLLNREGRPYYPDQDAAGRLKIDNFSHTRKLWLSAATIQAIAAFAASAGTPVDLRRGRLAALAA